MIVVPVHKPKRSVYGSRKHVSVLFLKFRTFFYDHRAGLGDPAFNWPRFKIRRNRKPVNNGPRPPKARPSKRKEPSEATQIRGCSSVGRAPDLHSGGRRFDPDQLHQFWPLAHRPPAELSWSAQWFINVVRDSGNGPVAQVARARP